jgi:hypothetical protein
VKTFKDVDEFIVEMFPQEYQKIIKEKKDPIGEAIENINRNFEAEMEKIMKGEGEKKK